jgi:TatD DNase family protein
MFRLFDSHCHLDAPELQGAGIELLAGARNSGILAFVIPGVRVADWRRLLAIAEQEAGVFAAPGLHPAYADQWSAAAGRQLRRLTSHPKVVAIGEIGLDTLCGPPLERQEKVLRAQLEIALEAGLPVLLHGRKATGRLLEILRELQVGAQVGGIWHGFSGSLAVAEELVRLGLKIGVGPILLRTAARKLPAAVRQLPAAALVLETDLPDMTEKPEALRAVAEKVAELRGWSLEEAARITTENACRLFGKINS